VVRVDLGGDRDGLPVYLPIDGTHPSTNRAWRRVTSLMCMPDDVTTTLNYHHHQAWKHPQFVTVVKPCLRQLDGQARGPPRRYGGRPPHSLTGNVPITARAVQLDYGRTARVSGGPFIR